MCVLRSHPIRFIFCGSAFDFMVWSRCLSLNQSAGVHLIFQNAINRFCAPIGLDLFLETRLVFGTTLSLIFIRRRNTVFIQLVCNLCRTEAIHLHAENALNDRSNSLVDDQFVFIIVRSTVAVDHMTSNKFAISSLGLQIGTNLDGNIPAIRVVNQVFERKNDFVAYLLRLCRVVVVVDGNKTDAQGRKNLLDISAGINVVTTKTGKVFDNDAVDFSCFDLFHHSLKVRTVKISTCITIIAELLNQSDLRVSAHIIFNQLSLISDTIAFFLLARRKVTIFLR